MLQTEGQVRAIFEGSVPKLPEEGLETRVEFRLRRRRALEGVRYLALVHEAALRIRVADRKVAREQLSQLLESEVAVRVVPFDVDGFAGVVDPAVYAGGVVPQLDTAMVDSRHGVRGQSMADGIAWQKSSFSSGGDAANCLENAAIREARHLRESEEPGQVVRSTPAGLAALIRHLRGSGRY